jgi:hypothetical protein
MKNDIDEEEEIKRINDRIKRRYQGNNCIFTDLGHPNPYFQPDDDL